MTIYSKMDRRLPDLFEAIIAHDNEIDEFFNSLHDVIPFRAAQNWRELKRRKIDLIRAADQYIKDAREAGNT